MRRIVQILIIFCSTSLWGQTGNYFLSHYSPSDERFDYVCFDMAQDTKGIMYFATKAGIIEFDGRDWDLLSGYSAVYSLQVSSSGEVYWAGAKGFGKIGLDKHGFQEVILLSDTSTANVFQAMIVKDHAYFLSENIIYVLDTKTNSISQIKSNTKEETFLKLFELYGVVYINTDHGTFKVDKQKLTNSRLHLTGEVIFTSRIDNHYVIGTSENRIYTCADDLRLKSVPALQDQAYINASVIVTGTWLNRQLLALGTLRGGVVFINPLNGVTQEIINYSTGLPDNEVFQLMTDVNQNVWVAHDYGFTKISPYLPLRSFNYYEGLKGNLLCAYSSGHTVYVGTSLGLFKLEKVDVYDELVYYVDVEIKEPKKAVGKNKASAQPVNGEPNIENQAKNESKKGGVFSFLKRNKNKQQDKPGTNQQKAPSSKSTNTKMSSAESSSKFRREKRIEKTLRSSHYAFKKVQGIDAKITHLVEVQGKLMASGLGGLYELNGLQAKSLMDEPIRYLYAPIDGKFVILSTYNNEVRSLRFVGNSIENSSLFSDMDDQIHYIFEGSNELWFCGIDKLYRAEVKDTEIRHKHTVELTQLNTEKTVGVVLNGEVIFANGNGFFHYQRSKNIVERLDSLPAPSQYFAHNGSIIYRDTHGWKFIGDERKDNNLQLLNVFQDLRFMASDNDPENLWLISGGNELYKFFGDKVKPFGNEFPIFLKSIFNQERKVAKLSEVIMDQEHSYVKFEVVQPDYINPQAVEFRYFLKGMQENWSEWSSNNNVIPFPYLPTGSYTLQVEARNIFGKVSTLEPLSFEVLPPYWKRSWFYALEFAIFASLVMLSFRLSTRYRIISRLLSLLTIILLIEFIQTAIGASISTQNSPVIDFIIQVIVALLVLPVEGYLRNLMLKSLDSSGKFYKFIVPQAPYQYKESEKFIKETTDLEK